MFQHLAEAIASLGERHPQRGYVFQNMKGKEEQLSFPEVEERTRAAAGWLREQGLQAGDRIALVLLEPQEFVISFLGALRAGLTPVPLYPPVALGQLQGYIQRTGGILRDCEARALLASSTLHKLLWSLVDEVPTLSGLLDPSPLLKAEAGPWSEPALSGEDTAFLQYTSGTTSDPKGIIVTHANLLANIECIASGLSLNAEEDVGVSWLPLYHDMGLIGFVLVTVVHGVNTVFIPTLRFVRRPWVWLDAMHRHRGTISFAPNFAYALAARRVKEEQLDRWDLSCVKSLGCGAEPIHPDTLRQFTSLYAQRCGLREEALTPAYGLAESTLCVSIKPLGTPFRVLEVDAEAFGSSGEITPAQEDGSSVSLVSCGRGFDEHSIAILSPEGETQPEGREGQVCVRGPSVTPGTLGGAHQHLQGWLPTGDLGLLWDGELYITGRIKDLIILNGRNLHPQSLEWGVGELEGVRKGNVVAFSVAGSQSEQLVMALETRLEGAEERRALETAVRAQISREWGLELHGVALLEPGQLPKTSSGKLQRHRARAQYLAGSLGREGSRGLEGVDRIGLARQVARSAWVRARTRLLGSSGKS